MKTHDYKTKMTSLLCSKQTNYYETITQSTITNWHASRPQPWHQSVTGSTVSQPSLTQKRLCRTDNYCWYSLLQRNFSTYS